MSVSVRRGILRGLVLVIALATSAVACKSESASTPAVDAPNVAAKAEANVAAPAATPPPSLPCQVDVFGADTGDTPMMRMKLEQKEDGTIVARMDEGLDGTFEQCVHSKIADGRLTEVTVFPQCGEEAQQKGLYQYEQGLNLAAIKQGEDLEMTIVLGNDSNAAVEYASFPVFNRRDELTVESDQGLVRRIKGAGPTGESVLEFEYNERRQLIQVHSDGQKAASYIYNDKGLLERTEWPLLGILARIQHECQG